MKDPEDVSIAGVGDNWADMISVPTLTTARLHQRRCGAEPARILLSMIEGEEPGGTKADTSDRKGQAQVQDHRERVPLTDPDRET